MCRFWAALGTPAPRAVCLSQRFALGFSRFSLREMFVDQELVCLRHHLLYEAVRGSIGEIEGRRRLLRVSGCGETGYLLLSGRSGHANEFVGGEK